MTGEQRTDVAVFADAEDRQVQRPAAKLVRERLVVLQRGFFEIGMVGRHPQGPRRAARERLKQQPFGDAVV